jgi:hypothetical protein
MDIINGIIKSVGDAIGWVVETLSFSPFSATMEALRSAVGTSEFLKTLNWIVPIAQAVALLEAWGLCVGIWYGASILLRWLKAVE